LTSTIWSRSKLSIQSDPIDLERLKEPLVFRAGLPGESYKGIGKELINVENLPVFADTEGPYGSPTSDSERAMIRMETTKAMLIIISFTGRAQLEEQMSEAAALLKQYSAASDLNRAVV
jgi:DNA/RNA-binding domain of Phe-tRNA-synthetase-like protein